MIEAQLPNGTVLLKHAGWRQVGDGPLYCWTSAWSPVPAVVKAGNWTPSDLAKIPGHWALIDLRGDAPVLTVDRQRSRPLVAAHTGTEWLVSDDIELFRGRFPFKKDRAAAKLFKHFGHTIGNRTLVRDVWDTPAASSMTLTTVPSASPYLTYKADESPITDVDTYAQSFGAAMDIAFGRFLQQAAGRQLVVPISAGFDSRLILTWLRKMGAENVVTYSYGVRNAPERATSEAVATALGYPFKYVELGPEKIRAAWTPGRAADYNRFAWGGTSLPHKQDWYAIRELVRKGDIQRDAIVLPGHTVPAAAARERVYTPGADFDLVAQELALANGGQQRQPEKVVKNKLFREVLAENADHLEFGDSERDNLSLWQWTALRERQAKFISNSVRVYEFFGLNWALLLHEPEIWEARQAGSDELTLDRYGYRQFVTAVYESVTQDAVRAEDEKRHHPPVVPTAEKPQRRSLRGFLTQTALARRLYRAFNPIVSPMGTEAFRPAQTKWQVLFGPSSQPTGNGLAASALLKGRGTGDFHPFD